MLIKSKKYITQNRCNIQKENTEHRQYSERKKLHFHYLITSHKASSQVNDKMEYFRVLKFKNRDKEYRKLFLKERESHAFRYFF